ncbi:hypothetical protein FALBO_11805 [Fusarium albosuccineum]|uniref:Uncharacterized protein n=1 Tax=Fusarium albosuccineum TaxID=1237068 RepID=A0A8H4P8L7_9HYPO|nr:hypothetical protein FALBO_11805 [Fusarium albosuccineum]
MKHTHHSSGSTPPGGNSGLASADVYSFVNSVLSKATSSNITYGLPHQISPGSHGNILIGNGQQFNGDMFFVDGVKQVTPSRIAVVHAGDSILVGYSDITIIANVQESPYLDHDPVRAGVFSNKLMDSSVGQVSGHDSVRDPPLNGDKDPRDVGTETPSKSDAASTRKCLGVLLDHASVDYISKRLEKSFGPDDSIQKSSNTSYDDAARNWYIHLTKLTSPDQKLLEFVGKFLQFAYWVEYSYTGSGDFQAIRPAEIALTAWSNCPPERDKALIHLGDYFKLPYSDLAQTYKQKDDNKALQWLALMRLGFYYFDRGRMGEMDKVRKEVSTSFSNLLDPGHPLALQARSDAAYSLLFNGDHRKALKEYADSFEHSQSAVGNKDPSPYFTLVFRAQAEYLSTDSKAALSTISQELEEFKRTMGPKSNGVLIAKLWYAIVDASDGTLTRASKRWNGCEVNERNSRAFGEKLF